MRLGRLEFGISTGKSVWGFLGAERGFLFATGPLWWGIWCGNCQCLMVDIGRFYITWLRGSCAEQSDSEES